MTDDPGKSPEGDETAEVELEDAPTRVRVVLVLRRAGKVLAAPASPGSTELVLPSHEVRAGQSIASSAKAIAAELLDRELGGGSLRGLCLVSPDDDAVDAVELCVAAKLDEGLPDEALVAKEPWGFHPENEVVWSAGAALALGFPAGAFTAVDLGGAVLPVGGAAASSELPQAYPPPLPQSPSPREVYVLGVAITGGVACVSGTIWALAAADAVNSQVALVLWVSLLVGVFALAAHGRPARRVAIGGALVLPFGFTLFVLAMLFGGSDAAHFAFWVWVFGLASLAVVHRRLGGTSAPTEQQSVRRRMLWAAAAFVSFVAVFPPLRNSIFKRGETATLDETTPTPRAPDDD